MPAAQHVELAVLVFDWPFWFWFVLTSSSLGSGPEAVSAVLVPCGTGLVLAGKLPASLSA